MILTIDFNYNAIKSIDLLYPDDYRTFADQIKDNPQISLVHDWLHEQQTIEDPASLKTKAGNLKTVF